MEYHGKLYGKVDQNYFPLIETAEKNTFFGTRFYFPDFFLLSSLHSIWQFSAFVLPPKCQGVM